MSREVKRVPLDFEWPLNEVWEGFVRPDRFDENPCAACCYERAPSIMDQLFPVPASGTGYAPHAQHLHDLWYGNAPFDPATTGSVPLRPDTPAVREFARRNVERAPEYYGTSGVAVVREAFRLAELWNGMWCHHLAQADVDALVDAGRLMDFTHTWEKGKGWQPRSDCAKVVCAGSGQPWRLGFTDAGVCPECNGLASTIRVADPGREWQFRNVPEHAPKGTGSYPTAAQVNTWSLSGFGHDSINAMIAVRARCEREGMEVTCPACGGHGSTEAYHGQRAEAEAWKSSEPPMGEGWQLWETVTEGSPTSPVFATDEELAAWMSAPERGRDWLTPEAALKFVQEGWAPTFVGSPQTGLVSGTEYMGTRED